jgi:hypothetical protein
MRGILFYNRESIRCLHLSVDPEGREVHFCRYDPETDSFEDLLVLREFRLSVPGNGGLEFSGYHPFEDGRFDFLTVEFFPSMSDFLHDSWVQKMSGRKGQTDDSIRGVR